ncbi:MAG: TolC family protein [Pseudomonadota bacterium]
MRLLCAGVALFALVAVHVLAGRAAWADDGSGSAAAGPALVDDPLLAGLVKEALEKRPEIALAQAAVQADRERVPQARALPDPVLSLGIQNDGFARIQIGEMETSYLAIMASQTFPWYGKRDLRGEAIALGTRQQETDLERTRLTVQAEVERAYVDLLLVRDQLVLLAQVETLWMQTEGMARVRYEVGDGAQSDILRAQLERSRLEQRRWTLEAEERRRVAVLNRLRGHPLDDVVTTSRSLADIPDPALSEATAAFKDAELRSPELEKWRLAIEKSGKLVELAEREAYPDVTVSAGLMPRGGSFPPMWQAGMSFSVPIWRDRKQARALEENRIRRTASQFGAEATSQLLRQRVTERLELLKALLASNRLYRSGLLVQSEATVSSTMAQYQVGRVTFAAVLEALIGYVADVNAFFDSAAAAQRVDIAQREVSLASVGGVPSGQMAPAPPAPPAAAGTAGSESMSRM